ncbi:MAG: hypothetical protein ACLFV3_01390 [Phycisphaeraceae bacterium]
MRNWWQMVAGLIVCAVLAPGAAQGQLMGLADGEDPASARMARGERQIVDDLCEKVYAAEVKTDRAGHVTGIWLSNHQAYRKDQPESEGVSDADMARLAELPRLAHFGIEKQYLVSAEGLEVLRQFPGLKSAQFHYLRKDIDPDFVLVVKDARGLETLELKHCFGVPKMNVQKLPGYPRLKRLVLDTSAAVPEAVELVTNSPRVEELELHRTSLSDGDFRAAVSSLRRLRHLWVRPVEGVQDPITIEALAALSPSQPLKNLMIGKQIKPLRYEDGLDQLAPIRTLERVHVLEDVPADHPAITKLRQARPDMKVQIAYH